MDRYERPSYGTAANNAARWRAALPNLTTKRLQLRPVILADFDAYAQIMAAPDAVHMGGPYTREEAWAEFVHLAAGWLLHGHGGWTICLNGDDQAIGFVILGLEPGDQEPELGYELLPTARGQGYATEAAMAARAYAKDIGLTGLVSYIAADHPASQSLAQRLNATRDKNAEKALNDDCQVWRHWGPETLPQEDTK